MQYSVPQFVDVEDKVVGPLTIRQFLWLLGGAGIGLVMWLLLPVVLAIIVVIPVALLSAAFAFYKVNGVAFHIYVANLMGFIAKPKTRVWKREVELDKNVVVLRDKSDKPKPRKVKINDVDLGQLVFILDHELSAQSKGLPITNAIERTAAPQAQVVLPADQQALQSSVQSLFSRDQIQMQQQMEATAEAAPAQTTGDGPVLQEPPAILKPTQPVPETNNGRVVTSVKPFRQEQK